MAAVAMVVHHHRDQAAALAPRAERMADRGRPRGPPAAADDADIVGLGDMAVDDDRAGPEGSTSR